MTQRIDVTVDDHPFLVNQRSDNDAVWTRIRSKAQTAREVVISRHVTTPPPPPLPPVPVQASPFGTAKDAGPFAGRGIMLGSNKDVWEQAHGLHVDVVAATVAAYAAVRAYFSTSVRVVGWCPPEQTPNIYTAILQAEKQSEWDAIAPNLAGHGLALNFWGYGKIPSTPALVECYYNEGWGIDFGIFKNYTAAGASAVIPLCGGYSAAGRTDDQAGRIYEALVGWGEQYGPFPGFWMYGGESLLTPQSVEALMGWKP